MIVCYDSVGSIDTIICYFFCITSGHWKSQSNSTDNKNNDYSDIPEYCYSAKLEEIKNKDYSLVPSKYIEFVNRDENIDFDEKMNTLRNEFTQLLKDEEASKKDLLDVFKELGYEIKL